MNVDEIVTIITAHNDDAYIEMYYDRKTKAFVAGIVIEPPNSIKGSGNTAASAVQNAYSNWKVVDKVGSGLAK